MTKSIKIGLGLVALVVLVGVAWYSFRGGGGLPTLTFESDQTLAGNYSVPLGTKVIVKNGATVTINGDLLVQGLLTCEGGPLNLVVSGQFKVERAVECARPETLPQGDVGNGIVVVAQSFDVGADAVVVSNGHVQFVTDASKVATTQEEIEKIYEEAATYRTTEQHLGPLTPLEQIPPGTPGRPVSTAIKLAPVVVNQPWWSPLWHVAQAQEPATDIEGNLVPNTNRIRGTWVVGDPTQPLPFDLKISTPPKGINKIILNFNFGANGMELSDFELTGPDGRAGKDESGKCTVTGGKGEDAMRLLAQASNIKVANFDLHLGAGGTGGSATTSKDCDPGVATGGAGGSSGNFKMVASAKFEITGAFNVYPGKGGAGGAATAFGKLGEDGCAGEKGGDATATGGKGGDNKKVLTVSGTVAGTENITIHEVVGGDGGIGTANGGAGGNGTGPKCAGGPGGKATATGGKGGDTTCAKFPCNGGNGGDASATAGKGGTGGQGTETLPGGDGGNGGDAVSTEGKGGAGKTTQGQNGTVTAEIGGDGGNGGDGCNEGKGGAGGSGNPPGKDGVPGKNLCKVAVPKEGDAVVVPGGDGAVAPIEEKPTTTDSFFDVFLSITPQQVKKTHIIGESSCPDQLTPVTINGPEGGRFSASGQPAWLQFPSSGAFGQVQPMFTCNIQNFEDHTEQVNIQLQGFDAQGKPVGQATLNVQVQVDKP